jgi:hypothetical protein
MEESAPFPEQRQAIICGQCGQTIGADETGQFHCPQCEPALDAPSWEESGEPMAERSAHDLDDELSELRIRQISALRRAADRARSYCLIGLIVLVVAAGQLLSMAFHDVRASGWHWPDAVYAGGALVGMIFAWRLWRRVVALTRELNQPLQTDPLQPPDFSTLNDGSQHVKHLEEM